MAVSQADHYIPEAFVCTSARRRSSGIKPLIACVLRSWFFQAFALVDSSSFDCALSTQLQNNACLVQMQQLQRETQEQSSKSMRATAQKERLESLARALRQEIQTLKAEQPGASHTASNQEEKEQEEEVVEMVDT